MKKFGYLILAVALFANPVSAQRITESLSGWTLGVNKPESRSGILGDGSTGNYLYCPVGTSPFSYNVETEGEGSVTFWIYDPSNCLAQANPGYPVNGPKWGLKNPLEQALCAGISRPSYGRGCIGYYTWSTSAMYSHFWLSDGIRGDTVLPHSNEEWTCRLVKWEPGWHKWMFSGTYDNIQICLFDCLNNEFWTGGIIITNAITTYDATYAGGVWAAMFGSGWKGFWVKGDDAGGVEDVGVDVVSGTGVFSSLGTDAVARPYEKSTWGSIKALYRK